jgi:LuxR family quorum sensing-dependent transcriptional regulator
MAQAHAVVFDWIDQLQGFGSADGAWRSFMDFIGRYGFHQAALMNIPRFDARLADNVMALSWPKAWGDRYAQANYLWRDPPVRGLAYSREPFTWAESLTFEDYSRADRAIMSEAGDFGLYAGLVVPIAGLHSNAVMSMAGGNSKLSARDRAELHFAALYAHARIRALSPVKVHRAAPRFTQRERECLEWAAAGKSDWEIGEILSIASKTAGAHIERAKEKLGVSTRIQAVVIALQSGAISI